MARVPKELFTQFQNHLNTEQELREVSIWQNNMIITKIAFNFEVRKLFTNHIFSFEKEIRVIMKEIDVSVREATLALQIIHTSLTEGEFKCTFSSK